MRSNALRKQDYTRQDYIQEKFKPGEESWEMRRTRIAAAVEQACNLPGNINGPDLGGFEEHYLQGACDLA